MKKILIALVIVVVIVIVIFVLANKKASAPEAPASQASEDTTAAINNSLDSLNVSDLDAEFQQIDAELNSL